METFFFGSAAVAVTAVGAAVACLAIPRLSMVAGWVLLTVGLVFSLVAVAVLGAALQASQQTPILAAASGTAVGLT